MTLDIKQFAPYSVTHIRFVRLQRCIQTDKLAAFTLIELLISVSLCAGSCSFSSLFVDVFKSYTKGNLHNQIYSEAIFIMDRITQEIKTTWLIMTSIMRKML